MSQPSMIIAKGDGINIQLAEWAGEGSPILCVHGLTANCRSFDMVAAKLIPTYRVLAMDLRGRGLSDKPDSGYSYDHHCQDIEAVIKDLDLGRVTLVGHSLGAYICLVFAATWPKLVDRLILMDGGAVLSVEQWGKVTAGIKPSLDRLGKIFPSYDDYIAPIKQVPFMKPWNETMDTYFRYESEKIEGSVRSRIHPEHIEEERANVLTVDTSDYYSQIKCPTLILRATNGMLAEDDLVIPEGPAQSLVKDIPQSKLVSLEGTNHFSIVFQPNLDRDRAILDFMSS